METREELAAKMRKAYLGDKAGDCMEWNELKQCIRDQWMAAFDATQTSTSIPVKVRFDVTNEEAQDAWERSSWNKSSSQFYMKYLSDHAVIEAPAGVPSVDELAEIGYTVLRDTYRSKGHTVFFDWSDIGDDEKESYIAQTAAIRDRVIAGMGTAQCAGPTRAEAKAKIEEILQIGGTGGDYFNALRDWLLSRLPETAPTSTYTDADVEALARVLCESNMDEWRHRSKEHIRQARAALDWMGATVGECKECEKLKEQRKALRKIVLDGAEEVRARIDAGRAALEGE